MRIVIIFLIFVISGCATLDHDHHRRKNSLSKAIETGNTGGSRRDHDEIDEAKWAFVGSVLNNENPPSKDYVSKMAHEPGGGDDLPNNFSFEVTRSIDVNNQVDDISRYSLIAGMREEYFGFLAHISITDYDFKRDWRYYNDLENPWAVEAGLGLQYYFNTRKNFIQPYMQAGFAYGKMFWGYTHSIYDSQTWDEITWDSTEYSRFSGAFGIDFKINDSLDLSVDIQKDYTIYNRKTDKGFDDDVMSNFGSTMFGARIKWRF